MKKLIIIIFLLFGMIVYGGTLRDFQKKQNDVNNRNRKHKNRKKIRIVSYPSGADIYINGKHHKEKTDTTVKLTIGKKYKIEVKKYDGDIQSVKSFVFEGYRKRIIFNLKPVSALSESERDRRRCERKYNPDIDACMRLQKKYHKIGKHKLSVKYGKIAALNLMTQCKKYRNDSCHKLGVVCVLLKEN